MKELKVGMYVRTKEGYISKFTYYGYNTGIGNKSCLFDSQIRDISNLVYETDNFLFDSELKKYVKKASFNIVDLIKAKDIILGKDGKIYQCWKIYSDYVFTYSKNKQGQTITLVDYQIDKVLTKEQFERMSYHI